MKTHVLTVEEFKKFIPRVKCINLFHYNLIHTAKLEEVSEVLKLEFEEPGDLENLRADRLAWYVNDRGEPVVWNARNARNLTVEEQASYYVNNPLGDDMAGIVESLRGGLSKDVEIISIHDTVQGQRVIVDGIYRAVALYYLYLTEKETIDRLLESAHTISCVIFKSPAGALLFPCDFINICRDNWKREGSGETP